ncbi:MAG TPA: hypothetical protein HA367_06260 [Candidatus Methanofastidiosum sp.]|nr:hypothetical protein [Methanofastidiosum sp.]
MDDNLIKTDRKPNRDEKGLFIEGTAPGPGRPQGQKNYLTLLEEALEKEAETFGMSYWERLAKWCFTNPKLASAVLKKFIPDKQHMEIEGNMNQNIDLSGLTIEEIKALAYGYTIENKSSDKKPDSKTGKNRAGKT